jgi:hypothetical protein
MDKNIFIIVMVIKIKGVNLVVLFLEYNLSIFP